MVWRGVALAAALVLSGCVTDQASTGGATTQVSATQKVGSPPASKSRIVILREIGYMSVLMNWDVKMDGQPLLAVKAGTYAIADVPPGRHQLTTEEFAAPGTTVRNITTAPGQTVFLLMKISDRSKKLAGAQFAAGLIGYAVAAAATSNDDNPGPYDLEPIDEATARQKLAELKPAS